MMDQVVLARNTMPGPTVFSDGTSKNAVVEWKGAGDLMGDDVQAVPETVVKTVDFQRAVHKGIFVIENAPEEIARVLDLQKQDWDSRQQRAKDASQAAMDQQPQNDLTMMGCIYPNGNGTACDTQVPVKVRGKYDAPVLCTVHKQFAPQFISETTDKFDNGQLVMNWTLPRVAPLMREN